MTLPLKKRATLFDEEFQHELEANAVFLLAHKLHTQDNILTCASSAGAGTAVTAVAATTAVADHSAKGRSSTPEPIVIVVDDDVPAMVTPPSTPLTHTIPSTTLKTALKTLSSNRTSSLPTTKDPIDPSFCMSLYTPGEEGLINPTHISIRRQVLEIRRTQSGKVYFQCGCCAHLPRGERAKYSTIAPQSLKNLYHAFIRFMMYHVPACDHIPQGIKELQPPSVTKDVKACGIKKYWRANAFAKGLRDSDNGRGIIYQPESS